MISIKILDIKTFMSELLVHDLFDMFLVSELEIITSNKVTISGKLYKDFYSSDELDIVSDRDHSFWKEIKPLAFNLIKGNKMPLSMKIILMLPPSSVESILEEANLGLNLSDINGLFLNIIFEKGELMCTTGSSVKVFTLDKSLDNIWDEKAMAYLKNKGITVEQI